MDLAGARPAGHCSAQINLAFMHFKEVQQPFSGTLESGSAVFAVVFGHDQEYMVSMKEMRLSRSPICW